MIPLPAFLRKRFLEGHQRSIAAKQNIAALFVLRGFNTAVNILLVPMTLAYLHQTGYGIWLTLSSIIGWVMLMDIGLGNGLRNEFAKAMANNDHALARVLISTTYVFVGTLVTLSIALFFLINPFLHWSAILNTPEAMEGELHSLASVIFVFFCLRLVFGLIGTVLLADQKPARSNLLEVLAAGFSLLGVYALTRISTGSLFWLGCVTSFSTVVVPLAANIWLFSRRYRRYAPSFRFVRFGQARQLMSLGVQFFLLQIAGVVIFATSNLVITQIFGASEVVPYNIAFKYYGLASMAFTVLLTPFWSAFTDAHTRGDTRWIAMTMRKLKTAWAVLACVVLGMTVVSNVAYALWVGPSVHVPLLLSASMAAYVLIVAWSTIFAYFINGTGKIRLQLLVALSTALAVIPLAILFSTRLELGTAGVMLAVCVALLPGCFLWPIQAKKIIEHRATGIWAR